MSHLDKLVYVNTVNTIVTIAEDEIKAKTGIRVRLLVVGEVPPHERNAPGMAAVISHSLGLLPEDYKNGLRNKKYVHARQLAAYFIKRYYPLTPLKDIGELIGDMDHTTVMYNVRVATNMIDTEDPIFLPKYEQVLQAVTQWIKE